MNAIVILWPVEHGPGGRKTPSVHSHADQVMWNSKIVTTNC